MKKSNFTGVVRITRGRSDGWIHTGDVYRFKGGYIIEFINNVCALDSIISSFFYPTLEYFCEYCNIDAEIIPIIYEQKSKMKEWGYV